MAPGLHCSDPAPSRVKDRCIASACNCVWEPHYAAASRQLIAQVQRELVVGCTLWSRILPLARTWLSSRIAAGCAGAAPFAAFSRHSRSGAQHSDGFRYGRHHQSHQPAPGRLERRRSEQQSGSACETSPRCRACFDISDATNTRRTIDGNVGQVTAPEETLESFSRTKESPSRVPSQPEALTQLVERVVHS